MSWATIVTSEHFISLGISIAIFLLFLLFRKIFSKYVFAILLKITRKAPGELFTQIVLAFEKPMQWLFIIIGVYVAASYFPYIEKTNPLFLDIIRSSIIFLISWGLFNLAGASSLLIEQLNEKYGFNIDKILIPLLSKTIRVIIIALGISIIAEEFDYSVGGFVAGLGLGGLAFALAAKDAIANLFGGIVIITEKPFTIGDWILTPTVEGTVEDITFRSTKIRTFTQALVTVPNATLSNEAITNWSKMGKRRINFNLRLPHDTPTEKVKVVVEDIQQLLNNHPGVHPETIFVTFDEFKENGLDLFLYFFTKTTDWGEYLKIKEDINYKILDILAQKEVFIALPSQKLYVDTKKDIEKQKKLESGEG